MDDTTGDKQTAFGIMTAMMRATKLSTNDFICAKRAVAPYASTNLRLSPGTSYQRENISVAAKFDVQVYDAHIMINQRLLNLLKKPSVTQIELSDQLSTLQVERGQRWADLVTPTALALGMLVDMRPTDAEGNFIKTTNPNEGETRRLVISQQEKKELLSWANEHFPEFVDGTPENKLSDPAKTAKMYLTFFDGRKCSDE